ncbi:MAG: calcium-binding protein [Candidatus Pacebacteria bacterium]|nr:calcium-binding protein [Candidatus Paceibacterota bacterium]
MESLERLQRNIGIGIGLFVIFAVGGTTFFEESAANASAPAVATTETSTTPTPVPTVPASTPAIVPKQTTPTASVYKDGTYTATGSYMSPGGEDQISVTLTLANDIITNVSAVSGAGDRTSQRYQNAFLSGYKQYVVGKDIANVKLTRVSGSSLTPAGFDNALAQIMAQAKA